MQRQSLDLNPVQAVSDLNYAEKMRKARDLGDSYYSKLRSTDSEVKTMASETSNQSEFPLVCEKYQEYFMPLGTLDENDYKSFTNGHWETLIEILDSQFRLYSDLQLIFMQELTNAVETKRKNAEVEFDQKY